MAQRKTLNIPKNPRKFNIWQSNIETEAVKKDVDIHNLGETSIPVYLMYEICEAYNVLYNKLVKEQLLITANPQSNTTLH